MNALHPDVPLAIEDCGDFVELAPFVELVTKPGMYENLIAELNAHLFTEDGQAYSRLMSQIQTGNTCEVVGTDLHPVLMNAILIVSRRSQAPG